jgi:hypothetical protein
MAADDDTRSGFSRRDALRLLAASTTTIAAGSIIVSRPALAGNGSQSCMYAGTPQATVRLINQSGDGQDRTDYLGISVQVPGSCPCDSMMVVAYAYSITIPGVASGENGWIDSSSVSVMAPGLWTNGGGTVTVTVGVRVTCGATTTCLAGTQTFDVSGPNWATTQTFALGDDCEASSGASAVISGSLPITLGLGMPPEIKPTKDATVDLGTPGDGSTTTSSSSTTTTDKPGNGPKDKKPGAAATTNTPAGSPTGSTTTTTSSTSSTSTTSTTSTTTTTSQP